MSIGFVSVGRRDILSGVPRDGPKRDSHGMETNAQDRSQGERTMRSSRSPILNVGADWLRRATVASAPVSKHQRDEWYPVHLSTHKNTSMLFMKVGSVR
jgi:hypothetical protein